MDWRTIHEIYIIRIDHDCEGRIKKSVPRITVWHHVACRVMANGDPEGRIFLCRVITNGDPEGRIFLSTLTQIMNYFSCSPLFFISENKLPEVPEYA